MKRAACLLISAAVLVLPTAALSQTQLPAEPPAQAPTKPSATHRALAAGYKALTVCSAVHSARAAGAGRTVASVEANELVGIYPELQPLVSAMTAEVAGDTVSVAWDAAAPARLATWTEGRSQRVQFH